MNRLTWVFLATATACSTARLEARQAQRAGTVTVLAAASLTEPFREIGRLLEQRHPGLTVTIGFGGSQQLAQQILEDAPADVFASADERWMAVMRDSGEVADSPRTFARNRLAVIVPASNPARITRLADLARPGVKLVLCGTAVPVGAYARQLLNRLDQSGAYGPRFASRVLANVVSQEQNVKAVVAKVQLGEGDAGIVYVSDVSPGVARFVHRLEIPDSLNVIASYPIAVLRRAANASAAGEFVALLMSGDGQAVLRRYGFLPASP